MASANHSEQKGQDRAGVEREGTQSRALWPSPLPAPSSGR